MGSRAKLSESQEADLYKECPEHSVPYDPSTKACKTCIDRNRPGFCSHVPPIPIWRRTGSSRCPEGRDICDSSCYYFSTYKSYSGGGSCKHPSKKWIITGWRKRR